MSGLDGQDLDWADPECELAATKIQAGFRGSKARKEVSAMKKRNNEALEMVKILIFLKNCYDS